MGRKYTFGPKEAIGWGLEECEERLLIAFYEEIVSKIRPGAIWKNDFEGRFFTNGEGVSETNLNFINAERRRLELPEFVVAETAVGEYVRNSDRHWKATARSGLRDAYRTSTDSVKKQWITNATLEIDGLLAPHYTLEELKIRRGERAPGLTEREQLVRQSALERAATPQVKPTPSETERFARMLALATKPGTINLIIQKLTPHQAMAVAESGCVTNEDVVDSLVVRALDER